jgi:hypothetical protein
MNMTELEKKLLAAARATPPSEAVPYAFEKSVMARLQAITPENDLLLWGRALWRGAIASLAIALACGAWVSLNSGSNSFELSQDLEHTITASMDEDSGW